MKILAVDDDELLLDLLVTTLRESGYTSIATATSATQAAQMIAAATERYDCFLLDIIMPEVDGIELTRWIRKIPQYRTAPIVMLTAMAEKTYIDRAFKAGASDYVTKPFDAIDVTARVQIAERQIHSGRVSQNSAGQIQMLRAQLENKYRAPLAEPIILENVEGLIDVLAMENYLLQMSRGSFVGTSLFALRIIDIGDLYVNCSPALFHDILADVAECALAALSRAECIMAYAGNGSFAGVVGSADYRDFEDLALDINMQIERLGLVDDEYRPLQVRVAVGAPQAIGVFHSGRWVVAQMRKLIEDLAWSMPMQAKQEQVSQSRSARLFKAFARKSFS